MTIFLKPLLIAAFAVPIALQAALGAAASYFRETDVSRALSIDSGDSISRARQSLSLLGQWNGTRSALQRPKKDATLALNEQALNPTALGVLAAIAETEQGKKSSEKLTALTLRTSRRDPTSHILEIERAVARNDIPGALTHYDAVFRVSTASDALLFPILSGAITDDQIRPAFLRYVKEDNPWLGRFASFSIPDPQTAPAWGDILAKKRGLPSSPGFRDLERQILFNLAGLSRFEALRTAYLSLPGARRESLTALNLEPNAQSFGVADWQLTDNSDVRAGIVPGDGKVPPRLELSASSPSEKVAARKLLLISPGTIRIAGSVASDGAAAKIYVTCVSLSGAASRIGMLELEQGGTFARPLVIPAGSCAAQYVDIVVRDLGGDTEGIVTFSGLAVKRTS